MNDVAINFVQTIAAGLRRKSLTTCSRWAEACRVLGGKDFPGPWRFTYHPWLREMHDSTSRLNVGKKSAQMGFSETVLNRVLFKIDVERVDCLYVLPNTTPDAQTFSASRFDPALELSPHLAAMFSEVKNVRHKRAGTANLYVRGSKSRSGLKSIPVGFLVLDEVDEMVQKNIPLAFERQSGQLEKEAWAISTPTIENFGIDKLFQSTTQEHFFIKCPCCSRLTELVYPECLEVTAETLIDPGIENSRILCKECKGTLAKGGGQQKAKINWLPSGRWVPSFTNRENRGFYINQFYSCAEAGSPVDMAKSYIKAKFNPADEQELYNSKLGLAHAAEGAKISDKQIDYCIKGHTCGYVNNNKIITMGVDVGKWNHVWIDEWTIPLKVISDFTLECHPRTLNITKVRNFEDLDGLMREYRVNFAVIDANPERRKSFEFSQRFWGYVKMCFYGKGVQGRLIQVPKEDTGEPTITVDRTSWLDLSLSRIRNIDIDLPKDIPQEAREHLKSLVRIYEKDQDGNPIGRYQKADNDEDHYAHARNYSEIALAFASSMDVVQDIQEDI